MAGDAFSGESRPSKAVDPIDTEPHRWLGVWIWFSERGKSEADAFEVHKQRRGRKEPKERLWHPISPAKSGRKKKSEDKRATRPSHPRSVRGAPQK